MEVLVTYDVSTETKEGRRRLQKVAKTCQAFGQRVQKSVFECTLSEAQFAQFQHRLESIIDQDVDSLRIYRLREPFASFVILRGKQIQYDMRGALVI